jgi:hypothetical protein
LPLVAKTGKKTTNNCPSGVENTKGDHHKETEKQIHPPNSSAENPVSSRGPDVEPSIHDIDKRVAVLEAQRAEDQKAVALVATGFKFLLLLLLGILTLTLKGH